MTGHRFGTAAIAVLLVASCGSATAPPSSPLAADGSPAATTTVTASPSPLAVAATPSPRRATPAAAAPTAATPRPTPHPTPTPNPTALAVPAPPSGATFKITPSGTKRKMTVSWKGPRGAGTEIRVYGVTQCIAMPPDVDPAVEQEGPCLVEHTPLPASVRKLVAKASASSGKVSWTWPGWEDIGWSLAMGRRHLLRSRRHRGLHRRGPLQVHHRRPGLLVWRLHLLDAPGQPGSREAVGRRPSVDAVVADVGQR